MSEQPNILLFPCDRLPAEAGAARLAGLYPQRQRGLWMQRVKVLGGRLTGRQWRRLGRLARGACGGTPLHLTTRQDIELHDLTAEAVPAVQRRLAAVGLTGLGACGDTLRNVTLCPCSGAAAGSVDLAPLAWAIRRELEAMDGIHALPRKLKIGLSCSRGCGQPYLNDLGLVARGRPGRRHFAAMVAGSLGAKPGAGMLLIRRLAPQDVLPLAVACVRLFAEHGDREHRATARLRHVRERLGKAAFRRLLLAAFEQARGERDWPAVEMPEVGAVGFEWETLTFANGDVSAEAAEALAHLADHPRVRVRIAPHHRVLVFGPARQWIRERIGEYPALVAAARPQAAVVACPGRRWCARALVDTNAIADRIRAVADGLPPGTTVCISGCPNGCAHSTAAPVGVVGRLAGAPGERRAVYDLFVDGDLGRSRWLARRAAAGLSADQLVDAVRALPAMAEAVPC